MTDVRPCDHLRAGSETLIPDGIYRVVGRTDEHVTLLYVADSSGTRCYSGRIERVTANRIGDEFETAPDPDDGLSFSDLLDPFRAFAAQIRYLFGV